MLKHYLEETKIKEIKKLLDMYHMMEDERKFIIFYVYLKLNKKETTNIKLQKTYKGVEKYWNNIYVSNYKYLINEFDEATSEFTLDEYRKLIELAIDGEFSTYQHEFELVPTLRYLITQLLDMKNNDSFIEIEFKKPMQVLNVIKWCIDRKIKLSAIEALTIREIDILFINCALSILYGDEYSNIAKTLFTRDRNQKYSKFIITNASPTNIGEIKETFNPKYFDKSLFSTNTTKDLLLLDDVFGKLEEYSRGAFLTISRVLFNEGDRPILNYLVDNGLLEGIIELPRDVYGKINTTFCLLIFSQNNNGVKLVDASELFTKHKIQSDPIIHVGTILDYYESATLMPNEELKRLSNWAPSSALINVEKPNTGTKFENIADIFIGSTFTPRNFKDYECSEDEANYKIITPIDIQDGKINMTDLKSIKCDDGKFDKFLIQEGDIILTSKSTKTKMAYVDKVNENIIVAGGMIIIRIKDSNVRPLFLYKFLESPRGQNAIKSTERGATIIRVNLTDLKKIIVPYNNGDKQEEINNMYIAYENELKLIDKQIAELNAKKDSIEEQMSSLIDRYFE